MVHHPDHKFLVIEDGSPGGITGPYDDFYRTAAGSITALTSRHSGMANIAFFRRALRAVRPGNMLAD